MRYVNTSPTASKAIGNVDRELRAKQKEAKFLGARYRNGQLSPEELDAAYARFTGIFRSILEEELQF